MAVPQGVRSEHAVRCACTVMLLATRHLAQRINACVLGAIARATPAPPTAGRSVQMLSHAARPSSMVHKRGRERATGCDRSASSHTRHRRGGLLQRHKHAFYISRFTRFLWQHLVPWCSCHSPAVQPTALMYMEAWHSPLYTCGSAGLTAAAGLHGLAAHWWMYTHVRCKAQ